MKLTRQNVPFTMVANEVLSRPDVSLKAKGLYAYLFSKPEGWDFAAERIAAECSEERKTIMRTLKELEQVGLLGRRRLGTGRMEYHLSFTDAPVKELTQELFAVVPVKLPGRELVAAGSVESPIDGLNELIEEFRPVNPSFARMFSNKSQRAAIGRIVRALGFEKVRNAIKAAVEAHGKPYAPTITTCLQLEDRIGALEAFYKKQGGAAVFAI